MERKLDVDVAPETAHAGMVDAAVPEPRHVANLLDGINGAFERAQLGRGQASRGETIALDDL
ncbi:MAG: hypothetical protein ACR2MU_04645 [Gaiellaceae bacterium]